MTEQNGFTILIFVAALAVFAAPYIISWRMAKLGRAVVKETNPDGSSPLYSCWATVKGKGTLTHQTMLCRFKVYSDRVGMKLLWGPERSIGFKDIHAVDRLLSGKRTTGFKIMPLNAEDLQEIIISGIADVPKFMSTIKANSKIELREMQDTRGVLDFIR